MLDGCQEWSAAGKEGAVCAAVAVVGQIPVHGVGLGPEEHCESEWIEGETIEAVEIAAVEN